MPTYQYRCKENGHELEVVQSFTDDPLESCPECGGRLKKVYGNVGISFKGSGFYKTDSRGSGRSSDSSTTSTKESTGSDGSASTTATGDSSKSEKSKSEKAPSTTGSTDST